MQNRGLIKFFAILFALVSIYQLSFTFVSHKIESDAKSYANGNSEKELKYLDSIGKEKVFNLGFSDFTYNEVKDKKINKGLDLEGGINVQLQISVKDIIKGLSNNSKNPIFNQALAEASKNRQGNQDYLEVFFAEFEKAADGKIKLSSPDIFANKILGDEVNFKKTDDEVKKVIRRKVDESIESAFEVLRKRIDKFGVTQPNIQKLGESGRILVELPGAKDVDRGKVEAGIPEDDPRNPAVIADNVGDNVGDCAGMAADLFESYEVTLVASIILGVAAFNSIGLNPAMGLVFPLAARAIGVIASIFGVFAVKAKPDETDALKPINKGFLVAGVLTLAGTLALSRSESVV